jgi:hypothetical protein
MACWSGMPFVVPNHYIYNPGNDCPKSFQVFFIKADFKGLINETIKDS